MTGRDLSILFELIPENHKLINFNTNTDGFSNGNKGAQLSENIKKLNSIIGFNSFDIGHVFDRVAYGGVAYINALCSVNKAGGATGGVNGTAFYFVFAHEIGHQLGAPHTFNQNVGVTTNRVELGSGRTIMGYGPRGEDNLYYHAKSIKEITALINQRNCGATDNDYNNQQPYYYIVISRFLH